jgi:hypothetical protein
MHQIGVRLTRKEGGRFGVHLVATEKSALLLAFKSVYSVHAHPIILLVMDISTNCVWYLCIKVWGGGESSVKFSHFYTAVLLFLVQYYNLMIP